MAVTRQRPVAQRALDVVGLLVCAAIAGGAAGMAAGAVLGWVWGVGR